MTDSITILTTQQEEKRKFLTKSFSCINGEIVKRDYDRAFLFDIDVVDLDTIDDLASVLDYLRARPKIELSDFSSL